uniref:Uncharacterized protein n=1 Tax=Romanomermis culicivorax TaxID=13658 RepID=A0A915KK59_ROMCU
MTERKEKKDHHKKGESDIFSGHFWPMLIINKNVIFVSFFVIGRNLLLGFQGIAIAVVSVKRIFWIDEI